MIICAVFLKKAKFLPIHQNLIIFPPTAFSSRLCIGWAFGPGRVTSAAGVGPQPVHRVGVADGEPQLPGSLLRLLPRLLRSQGGQNPLITSPLRFVDAPHARLFCPRGPPFRRRCSMSNVHVSCIIALHVHSTPLPSVN